MTNEHQLFLPRKDWTVDEEQHRENATALETWAQGPFDWIGLTDGDTLPDPTDYPEGAIIVVNGVQYIHIGGLWLPTKAGDGADPGTPVGAPLIVRAVGVNILNMSSYTQPIDHAFFLPEFAESTDGGATWTGFTNAPFGPTDAIVPHGNLDYAKLYKYRFRTEDVEGRMSGYSPESDPVAPRRANEGGVIDIEAGTITADLLSAIIVMAGLLTTGLTGQRVQISKDGIRSYDAANQLTVNIPVIGDAAFTGGLVARSLDLLGPMIFRATTPDHEMSPGAKLHMGGSLAVTDPATPPVLDWTWDSLTVDSALSTFRRGLWYDAAGTGGATWWMCDFSVAGKVTESLASTGVRQRSVTMASNRRAHGAVRVSTTVYVLVSNTDSTRWFIQRRSNTGLGLLTETEVTSSLANNQVAGISYNGTNLLISERSNTGFVRVAKFTAANPPAFVSATVTTTPVPATGGTPGVPVRFSSLRGIVEVSSKWYVLAEDVSQVVASTTAGADAPADYFPTSGELLQGIGHDGTQFWTNPRDATAMRKHTNWTSATAYVQASYTWYEPTGTKESLMSPGGVVAFSRRAKLRVSFPSIPAGASQARVYADETSSSTPSVVRTDYKLDTAYSAGPATMAPEPTGANPPSSNSFGTSSTPAQIYGANGLLLEGDGTFLPQQLAAYPATPVEAEFLYHTGLDRPAFRQTNATAWSLLGNIGAVVYRDTDQSGVADGAETNVLWPAEIRDVHGYHSTSSNTDRLVVPASLGGKHQVNAQVRFEPDADGRRHVRIYHVTSGGGTTTLVGECSSASAGAGAATVVQCTSQSKECAVGDWFEVRVLHTAGNNLSLLQDPGNTWAEIAYTGG